jgi:hypothetical protein
MGLKMAKKLKIKLTKEQKVWHENLEWYLKNKVSWKSEQNTKDAVLDGKYAVLFASGKDDYFSSMICIDCKEGIDVLLAYCPSYTTAHAIELDHMDLVVEVRKSVGPDWSNWIEKNSQEKK